MLILMAIGTRQIGMRFAERPSCIVVIKALWVDKIGIDQASIWAFMLDMAPTTPFGVFGVKSPLLGDEPGDALVAC